MIGKHIYTVPPVYPVMAGNIGQNKNEILSGAVCVLHGRPLENQSLARAHQQLLPALTITSASSPPARRHGDRPWPLAPHVT